MASHRSPPGRHHVPRPRSRQLRCGSVHVPRPGSDPDQGTALRRGSQRHVGPADRAHRARSRHGIRHRRSGSRRPASDGRGAAHGGGERGISGRGGLSGQPEPLRDIIARHGLSASKALGQNFILDRQLLAKIAAIPGHLQGERVYEVGPGPGGLTRALLDAGASVTAIERDRRCIPALAELRDEFGEKLQVVEADALKVDEPSLVGRDTRVVANLPYNVGTALLLRWLETDWPPWWRSLTLMFQKEVAERIVARRGSGAYGRLSVAAQWRTRPRIAMTLNRSAFVPPPKVTSAAVHIVPLEQPKGVKANVMKRLTEAAFGQRRKMLRSSLKAMPGALDAAQALGIDPKRRAETLSVDEWVALARTLSD